MLRKSLILACIAGVLAGCALPGAKPVPTPFPEGYLPTVVALTAEAAYSTSQALTPVVLPTDTLEPTATIASSTPLPTRTYTPQPKIPLAQIQFLAPGPLSRIVSPVQLQLMVVSGESEIIQIDLFGEDGRLLGRKIDRVNRHETGVYATYKLPFEIRAAAETALLQVSTKDKQGRMQSLNSLQLILLSAGTTEVTPAGNVLFEHAVFFTPKDKASVVSSELPVRARFSPFNNQPVFLELILPDRRVLVSRVLTLDGLEPQEFTTTLPFKVTEPTSALLSLRQMDPILNAPIYVYTQTITLNP
ncbi:MAG TPA: hypothetical protein VGJ22_04450 [Anaerolineales bacterium]